MNIHNIATCKWEQQIATIELNNNTKNGRQNNREYQRVICIVDICSRFFL